MDVIQLYRFNLLLSQLFYVIGKLLHDAIDTNRISTISNDYTIQTICTIKSSIALLIDYKSQINSSINKFNFYSNEA